MNGKTRESVQISESIYMVEGTEPFSRSVVFCSKLCQKSLSKTSKIVVYKSLKKVTKLLV